MIWTLIRPKQAAVEAALFEGVRAVDAASIYGTEREVGRAVRTSGLGKQVLVTTKLPAAAFSDLRGAVGRSLDALGSGMEKPLVVLHPPLAPKAAAKILIQTAKTGATSFCAILLKLLP